MQRHKQSGIYEQYEKNGVIADKNIAHFNNYLAGEEGIDFNVSADGKPDPSLVNEKKLEKELRREI